MPEAVACKNCRRKYRDPILLDENGLCAVCHSCRVPELIAEIMRLTLRLAKRRKPCQRAANE